MRWTRLLGGAVVAAVVACGDPAGPRTPDVSGPWYLESMNGAALPFVIEETPDHTWEVVGSVLVFDRDGTFDEHITATEAANGDVTYVDLSIPGSWSQRGVDVTLVAGGAAPYGAVIDGPRLTHHFGGRTWTYVRH